MERTREQLIAECRAQNLRGYSGKNKADLIAMLANAPVNVPVVNVPAPGENAPAATPPDDKKVLGQFYTTRVDYILDGFEIPVGARVIEPFAGQGDLAEWAKKSGHEITCFDIDPKYPGTIRQDTLANPPDYTGAWVLTNPPYLARNKSADKTIYDKYDTNDLYKAFILSISAAEGGIMIIPAGFFFSPRDIDVRCRAAFMSRFRLDYVRYFEETVFDDTTTTIVACRFTKSPIPLTSQVVPWRRMPGGAVKEFTMTQPSWIIGGDIYSLPVPTGVSVRRHVDGNPLKPGEHQLFITLSALDSGTQAGRINMSYKRDYIYPAKECSRTFATLRITGRVLSEAQQITLCREFNEFLEQKREETWSLFLPQYRESKEYARKRIPFDLAYKVVLHLLGRVDNAG